MRGELHALPHAAVEDNPACRPSFAAQARGTGDEPRDRHQRRARARRTMAGNEDQTLLVAREPRCRQPPRWGSEAATWKAPPSWCARSCMSRGPAIIADDSACAASGPRGRGPALGVFRRLSPFNPLARLPDEVRRLGRHGGCAHRPHAREPGCGSSLIRRYLRALAAALPRATQIPPVHLFPRVERSCAIRIPPVSSSSTSATPFARSDDGTGSSAGSREPTAGSARRERRPCAGTSWTRGTAFYGGRRRTPIGCPSRCSRPTPTCSKAPTIADGAECAIRGLDYAALLLDGLTADREAAIM